MTVAWLTDLERFGPEAPEYAAPTLAEASAYCRRLAKSQYENFTVASWLLPGAWRTHFYHVYAYCRWADDLADECGDPARSLLLLDWWEQQLNECYLGAARHPVFVALADTIRAFDIPRTPFADLLRAFRQDQVVTRYDTFADLLDYCRYSANPVGRLVLYLARAHDEERGTLADSICTGLQLANFWQDVARDFDKGRVYLPREDREAFGYGNDKLQARVHNESFRRLMAFEVDRAEKYLRNARPLVAIVPRRLRFDVQLFIRGGLAILEAIRHQQYDVWTRRPTLNRWTKARIALTTLLGLHRVPTWRATSSP